MDKKDVESLLSGIRKFVVDFTRIIAPFSEQLRYLSANLQAPLEAFARALARFDFSALPYDEEWKEKHDILVKFGWFYSNELPDELVDEIIERAENIKKSEVDQIIVAHFRKDRCGALRRIVHGWETSQCFLTRKHVFNQALHCHSRRIYNASVTMLTLHVEGVITDFARVVLDSQCKAKKALEGINDFIEGMPFATLTFSDWGIFSFVIKKVQAALSEDFDLSNPETASNNSRHKIAHGHVVEKETEANSLRRFLYLNELYRIFSVIGKELEMESLQGSNPAA